MLFRNKKPKPDSEPPPIPEHIISLDETTISSFIAQYPVVFIDFWAPWCGPCKTMAPRMRRLNKLYEETVAFGKLNTQENPKTARQYHIMGIPHCIIFHKGKKQAEFTGVKSVGAMKKIIDGILDTQ